MVAKYFNRFFQTMVVSNKKLQLVFKALLRINDSFCKIQCYWTAVQTGIKCAVATAFC